MPQLQRMKQTFAQQHCRATAMRVALFVGTVLFSINHGSALVNDEMSPTRWASGLITYLVPFTVSIHGQSSRRTA